MVPEPEGRDWFKSVTDVTGIAAGLAALVYITGGLALQLGLGSGGVPSSVAVPQLPREFLISLGLLARRAGGRGGSGWPAASPKHRKWNNRSPSAPWPPCSSNVVIGWLVVSKNPFPAKVCLAGGGEVDGVFIGETDRRTYLADLDGNHRAGSSRSPSLVWRESPWRADSAARADQLFVDRAACPRAVTARPRRAHLSHLVNPGLPGTPAPTAGPPGCRRLQTTSGRPAERPSRRRPRRRLRLRRHRRQSRCRGRHFHHWRRSGPSRGRSPSNALALPAPRRDVR